MINICLIYNRFYFPHMGPKTDDFRSDGTTQTSSLMHLGPGSPLLLPLSPKDFALINTVNFDNSFIQSENNLSICLLLRLLFAL